MPVNSQSRADLLEILIIEVLNAFFALRRAGQDLEMVSESGGGLWGLLRILAAEGPKTLSDVARLRGVSRQYIQKLASQLAGDDLIRMTENPADRRSKLMVLTPRGEARFAQLTDQFQAVVRALAPGFRASDLKTAGQTVAKLRGALQDAVKRPEELSP